MKNLYLLFFIIIAISCDKKEEKKEVIAPALEVKKDTTVQKEPIKQVGIAPILIFTVQLGAFENSNNNLASLENIKIYHENGLTKYRLGAFKTYQEARDFRKSVLVNYPDAFVQTLKNNYPIPISEALIN